MNYRKSIVIITACLALQACTELDQQASSKFDIKSVKTTDHVRVLGSRVFVRIADTYKINKITGRYENGDQYFHIMESPGMNDLLKKKEREEKVSRIIRGQVSKIDVYEKIMVNNHQGVYFEGPSGVEDTYKLGVWFSGKLFSVFFLGIYNEFDEQGKADLLNVISSIYHDSKLKLDIFELANFSFDESVAGFKLVSSFSNFFVYAPSKSSNDFDDKTMTETINIGIAPVTSVLTAETLFIDMLTRTHRMNATLETKKYQQTTIAGYPALLLKTPYQINTKDGIENGFWCQAILIGKNSGVTFLGMCKAKNAERYATIFDKTIETIKIKE